jgi:NhaP-type Na+/H+ or K+/H+ antiporter
VASLAVAVFLVRFYHTSRERLFALFAGAFGVLALHWALLGILPLQGEHRPLAYILRLLAFLLILVAIIDKNRRP